MIKDTYYESACNWLNAKYKTGCIHHWVYDGHGHNYSCYKCTKCNIEGDY